MVDRFFGLLLAMFTHSAHGGTPLMKIQSLKHAKPIKIAEICGFYGACLRFINRYSTIMGSRRALTDRLISGALFYCRNCLFICLALMNAPATYVRHSNKFSAIILRRGQFYAHAFFLETRP